MTVKSHGESKIGYLMERHKIIEANNIDNEGFLSMVYFLESWRLIIFNVQVNNIYR